MKRIMVTGGAGFFGTHFIEHCLKNTDWEIISVDSFKHQGDSERTRHLPASRVKIICHDLNAPISHRTEDVIGPIDYIANIASDSHIPRSIEEPVRFIENNTNLMMSVLQYARRAHPKKLIHLASDEIFGPASDGVAHTEKDRFNPSSPYSASKAAQTCYAMSWWRTYQTPVMTVCPANMFAERQSPEKFLPLCISKIVKGEIIKIHGLAGRIGRRTYMHARNISDAILFLLNNVEPSKYNPLSEETQSMEMFNIFGKDEFSNLEIAQKIAKIIDKPLKYELVSFQEVRPGHDFLYRCNDDKIRNLGWREPVAFEESLERMVKWTIRPENSIWLK